MFTGLVQKVGVLRSLRRVESGWSISIAHDPWSDALELGESIAVQGACLSVTGILDDGFTADLLDETLQRTALRNFQVNAKLNLERALALGDRLGGHIVTGHIDECGTLQHIEARNRDYAWRIGCSKTLAYQNVMKGSIAIDGVSLTISAIGDDWLEVNLIPLTLKSTSLRARKPGDEVNLEGDILGKYVARLLQQPTAHSGVSEATLAAHGFI